MNQDHKRFPEKTTHICQTSWASPSRSRSASLTAFPLHEETFLMRRGSLRSCHRAFNCRSQPRHRRFLPVWPPPSSFRGFGALVLSALRAVHPTSASPCRARSLSRSHTSLCSQSLPLSLSLSLSISLFLSDVDLRSPVPGSREMWLAGQQIRGPASSTQHETGTGTKINHCRCGPTA